MAGSSKETDNRPNLPWITHRGKIQTMLQMDQNMIYCKRYLGIKPGEKCGHKACNRLTIHTVFNEVFPKYLPASYHSMDAVMMRKKLQIFGLNYWNYAIPFVRTCSDLATLPFCRLNDGSSRLRNMRGNQFKEFMMTVTPQITVKDNNDYCRSSAEFLLEPWVLIQLPFQPALLHQWAVAAYAESLIFSKRIVEIGTRGYAPRFHDLFAELYDLSRNLSKFCNMLLSQFFLVYGKNFEESVHVKAQKVDPPLSEQLAAMLSMLQFVLSDDCAEIFNCIKRKSWGNGVDMSELVVFSPPINQELCLESHSDTVTPYRECFWLTNSDYSSLSQKSSASQLENFRITKLEINDQEFEEGINCPKKIQMLRKKHMEDIIVKNPLTKNFKNIEIFLERLQNLMPSDKYSITEHCQALLLKEIDFLEANIPVGGGILYDILALQANLNAELYLGFIEWHLWHAAQRFDSSFQLDVSAIPVPLEFSVQKSLDQIEDMKSNKANWSTEKILAKLEEKCSKQPEAATASPVETFRRRIQKLVLGMYKKFYQALREGRDQSFPFNPECLFVQYILPCYVAMVLDVQKDPEASLKAKEEYTQFVDLLIKSYEEVEYVQDLGKTKKREFCNIRNIAYESKVEKQLFEVFTVLDQIFHDSLCMQILKFTQTSKWSKLEIFPRYGKVNRDTKELLPCDSSIQLERFCARMKLCFVKVGWQPKTTIPQIPKLNVNDFRIFSLFKDEPSAVDQLLELSLCDKSLQDLHRALSEQCKKSIRRDKLRDLEALTIHQLCAVSVFEVWSRKITPDEFFRNVQGPIFPLDPLSPVASMVLNRDWRNLFKIVAPITQAENLGMITLAQAKSNSGCRFLLNTLNKAGKLKMDHPGEVTFFPVQHCRWCGLVYATEFHLCAECKDEPGYPDPNYFCSEACETGALEKYHTEEHATYVMEKLNLM